MHYRAVGAVAAVAVTAAALVGCSTSDDGGGSGDNIVTWSTTSGERAAVEAVVEAFEAETGIEVEVTLADTDNYLTTTRTQLGSGTGPDVLFVFAGASAPLTAGQVGPAGLVENLDGYDFADEVSVGFRQAAGTADGLWTAPVVSSSIGTIYNQDLLDQHGLEVPTTWSEVIQLCSDARDLGLAAYSLAGATQWQVQLLPYALAATLVYEEDPEFAEEMNAGNTTFSDSAWVDVFEQQAEMVDAGCFQDGFEGTVYEDVLNYVATGQVFGSVQVGASLGADAAEDVNVTFVAFPATDDPEQTWMPLALGASYGINADADHPENARRLIEFLTSDEGANIYATAVSGVPALPNDLFEPTPEVQETVDFLAAGRGFPFMDQTWPNPNVQQSLMEGTQLLIAGDIPPAEVAARMDAAFQG